jgi:large subunit ribosomal protein L13
MLKTYSQKASEVNHNWVIIDASTAPLGRVATVIAQRLTGKYKPTYTPSMDDGDYVVVINANDVVFTGDKETSKIYYSYSGFPSGLKERTVAEAREKDARKIVSHAVSGMLPRNKLHAERMKRLRVFSGSEHEHTAQKPKKLEIVSAAKPKKESK